MQHNIILPDLGQTTGEAKIVQWLKKAGDRVSRGEPIVAVETDKVDMEVESFASGYLREVLAEEGSTARALATVAILTDSAAESYSRPGEEKAKPAAAPAARALARKLGVDIAQVQAGPKGLVTSDDVQRFFETAKSGARPVTHHSLAAMAVTVANSKRDVPHFYAARDLEVTPAARWRDRWNQTQEGAHASFNDVFVWSAARALGDVPRMNLAYRDGAFEQRSAADVLLIVARDPALLLAPLEDPRALEWKEFLGRLHESDRQRNPMPVPLLAISNLGMYGIKEFSAIIPPGCSSVLAIGAVREAPLVRNGAVVIEKIATVTLSADHRVIDGITAARFLERMQVHLNAL